MDRNALGRVLAAFLGGVAGAAVGCNFIVGAGDYSVGEDASVMDAGRPDAAKGLDTGNDRPTEEEAANSDAAPMPEASEASTEGGEGEIGDPCTADAGCAVGSCNGAWCQTSCASPSDTSCGNDSIGETNRCVEGSDDAGYECFPGCADNASCTPYSVTVGTTCVPVEPGSSELICSAPYGYVGDPCSNTNDTWSQDSPCLDTNDAGSAETCNGVWCSALCTGGTDTSCGSSSTGQSNFCVSTKDLDGGFTCFPGCKAYGDCAPYPGTFCEPIFGTGGGPVCAVSGGSIGDPCTRDADCTVGTCLGSWCSQACLPEGSSTVCGINSEGITNYCIVDDDPSVNANRCFPGCNRANGNADCTPFPPSKVSGTSPACNTLSTPAVSICSFP